MSEATEAREPVTPTGGDSPGHAEQRTALIRLVAVVAGGLLLALLTGTFWTVAVVIALIAMIMLHELGHYLTAKWSGMKVTEYFLGFGPRLWSVRRGETEYGVKAIPAGGYVKIVGMHNLDKIEDAADEPRTYRQQSYPKRLAVVLAGSAMHFIIAIVLLFAINAIVGIPQRTLAVGEIVRLESGPSPAAEAGLQIGDRIVAVDGQPLQEWEQLPPYIRERPGETVELVVERDAQEVALSVTPADLSKVEIEGEGTLTDEPVGFVGISPAIEFEQENPIAAAGRSVTQFGTGMKETVKALVGIFSPTGVGNYFDVLRGEAVGQTGDGGESRFLSPVGFVRVAGQAAEQGLFEVLTLLVLINIFVGIFNLLPLLPLDGGHVAIATYEAIRSKIAGRRYFVDVSRLLPATYLVFIILVFIGVTSLYLDIVRPIDNPFQ